jgi:hypothetical protein
MTPKLHHQSKTTLKLQHRSRSSKLLATTSAMTLKLYSHQECAIAQHRKSGNTTGNNISKSRSAYIMGVSPKRRLNYKSAIKHHKSKKTLETTGNNQPSPLKFQECIAQGAILHSKAERPATAMQNDLLLNKRTVPQIKIRLHGTPTASPGINNKQVRNDSGNYRSAYMHHTSEMTLETNDLNNQHPRSARSTTEFRLFFVKLAGVCRDEC